MVADDNVTNVFLQHTWSTEGFVLCHHFLNARYGFLTVKIVLRFKKIKNCVFPFEILANFTVTLTVRTLAVL